MSNPEEQNVLKEVPEQKPVKGPRKGGLFSLLAFILIILAMAAFFFMLTKMDHRFIKLIDLMQERQQTLQNEMAVLQTSAVKTSQMEADLINIKQSLNEVTQFQQANKTAWSLSEARYLVKLANDHLQYTGNIALALKLLTLADQSLVGMTDPKLVPVRQALANDIAHLQSVSQVDVDGLYARLAALQGEIDQLPLIDQPVPTAASTPQTVDNRPWWQRGLTMSWDTLKSLVVIRHNEKGNLLLLPEQKIVLYQNLHATVSQAIWALLHGQQDIYLSSLQQIETWIKQYFMLDQTITQAVLTQLTNLQNLYIRQATPTITALTVFQNVQ